MVQVNFVKRTSPRRQSAQSAVEQLVWPLGCTLVLIFSFASLAAPPITAIAFTPDVSAVVVGSQAGLEIRSWPLLESIATLPTELASVHDLEFSLDGKLLAAVGGTPAEYGTAELYRWPDRELIRRFDPHDDLIYAVAWRNDSKQLALASADHRVGLCELTTQTPARMLEGHSKGVLGVVYLLENRLLTAGVDASIRLWEPSTGQPLRTFANHTRTINDLALRPNAPPDALPMIASCSDDRTVRFWQPTIGRLVRFARLDSAPLAIAWTPDGGTLWAACFDGHVRAINPSDARIVRELPALDGPAYSLAIAPDGSLLAAGYDAQICKLSSEGEEMP